MSQDTTTDEVVSTSNETTVYYPIRFVDCGSVYARRLFDVDGNPLLDWETGETLHLSNARIMDHFNNKMIRCVRHPVDDYRYFVQSEEQKQRFIREREEGTARRSYNYYIYRDSDTDQEITRLRQKVRRYQERVSK